MKVLFVSNDPTIFDPESAARQRMHAYARALGGELHIVSPARFGTRGGQEGSLFLHPIPSWRLLRLWLLTVVVWYRIFKDDIDLVSAQDPFEQGLAALYAVSGSRTRLHIQVHTDVFSPWFARDLMSRGKRLSAPRLNRHRLRIAEHVLPHAHGIRVVSERVKASLAAHFGARIREPVVIPVAVDATVPPPVPLPASPFKFTMLSVGRLEPEKRVGDLLIVLKILCARYPMAGLFIAGDGRERAALEKRAQELGVAEHVVFLGDRPDARALMGSASVFVQASAYEGYGRTLIEAALAKVPIVTTDVGLVGTVFQNGVDVLAVPVGDTTAFAEALIRLIEETILRIQLSVNAELSARTHLASFGDLPARVADDLQHVGSGT